MHPRRSLMLSGILVLVVVPLPLFAALLILRAHSLLWLAIVAEVICLAITVVGYLLFRATYVLVTDTHLVERGLFHAPVTTDLSHVHSVVLTQIYSTSSSETLPQLIVRDEGGKRILRMRGFCWTEETMRRAAKAIGRPLDEPSEPLTPQQFLARFTGSAYWWESRRPLAVALIVAIGALGAGGVVLGLMWLLRLPIVG